MDTNVIVLSFRDPPAAKPREQHGCWVATQAIGRWGNESHLTAPPARPPLIRITRVPEEVTRLLAPLTPSFSSRHYLVFCWLLAAPVVCFDRAPLPGVAR
jgi:hypothetical protein